LRATVVVLGLSALSAKCGSPAPTLPTPVPPAPPPPPALTITCPGNQTGLSIRNQPVGVSWSPPATSGGVAPHDVTCTPASGSSFLPGVTNVACAAADAASQRATCGFSVTITRPPQLSVSRFLAYGDSITWGRDAPPLPFLAFPEPPPATSYPSQMAGFLTARYLDQLIEVVNEGWPGEAVDDGLKRLPSVLSSAAPHVLLLLDGANDLLGKPRSATTVYIADKLQDMVRTAKRNVPGIRILLANFPPQYHGTVPYNRGAGAEFVPELNGRIAQVAQAEGVTLVDLYTPLLPNLKQNIGGDGLHPTVKGFTLMAEAFLAVIQQTMEMTPDAPGGLPAWHAPMVTPGPGPCPGPGLVPESMPAPRPRLRPSNTERPGRGGWSDR